MATLNTMVNRVLCIADKQDNMPTAKETHFYHL